MATANSFTHIENRQRCKESPQQLPTNVWCNGGIGWEARGSGESQLFLCWGHLGMSAVGCCGWTDECYRGR